MEPRTGQIKLTTKMGDRTYDLKEVFDILKDLKPDINERFNHIIKMFESHDGGIRRKVEVLKIHIVRNNPDKYSYEHDDDDDDYSETMKQYERMTKRANKSSFSSYKLLLMLVFTILFAIGVAFFLLAVDPEDIDKRNKTTDKPAAIERLQPL